MFRHIRHIWKRYPSSKSGINRPLIRIARKKAAEFKKADPLFPHVRYLVPTLYGITLSSSIFMVGASLRKHEVVTAIQQSLTKDPQATVEQIIREHEEPQEQKRTTLLKKFRLSLNSTNFSRDLKEILDYLGEKIIDTSEAQRTLLGLVVVNTIVFSMWKIPRLTPWMYKWFTHLPGSQRNITLLTSCFSHKSFIHLASNMIGLCSFGSLTHSVLDREQFLAMYLGTGICANVVSHIGFLVERRLAPLLPLLGASGAVYGLMGSVAAMAPTTEVFIIFLPFFTFELR